MGDAFNEFHSEAIRPKVTELLNPMPTDYSLEVACGNESYSSFLAKKGFPSETTVER